MILNVFPNETIHQWLGNVAEGQDAVFPTLMVNNTDAPLH